jgi:hypothetical protein
LLYWWASAKVSTGKPTPAQQKRVTQVKTTSDYYNMIALQSLIRKAQEKKHSEGKHSVGLQRALEHIGKRLKEEG